jgi:hypothetical protein
VAQRAPLGEANMNSALLSSIAASAKGLTATLATEAEGPRAAPPPRPAAPSPPPRAAAPQMAPMPSMAAFRA